MAAFHLASDCLKSNIHSIEFLMDSDWSSNETVKENDSHEWNNQPRKHEELAIGARRADVKSREPESDTKRQQIELQNIY